MGLAQANLPDPLEGSLPARVSNADDLLAQMAGDEIDRLLNEAEVDPSEGVEMISPEDVEANEPVGTTAGFEISPTATAGEGIETGVANGGEENSFLKRRMAAPKVEMTAALEAQLDDLFAELNKEPEIAPTTNSPPAIDAGAAITADVAPAKVQAAVEATAQVAKEEVAAKAEEATSSAERAALKQLDSTMAAMMPSETEAAGEEETEKKPSLLIKLLMAINEPFAGCSPWMRNFLGKVGIVTLIYAVIMLGYLLFRNK